MWQQESNLCLRRLRSLCRGRGINISMQYYEKHWLLSANCIPIPEWCRPTWGNLSILSIVIILFGCIPVTSQNGYQTITWQWAYSALCNDGFCYMLCRNCVQVSNNFAVVHYILLQTTTVKAQSPKHFFTYMLKVQTSIHSLRHLFSYVSLHEKVGLRPISEFPSLMQWILVT